MKNSSDVRPLRVTDNVHREILPNGLTLLVKENHNAPVAAILVSVQVGYFHEPDRVNGIAHVVEHMLFKGTPSRPEDEQIAREIRALGGYVNAATYYEETYYYTVVPSQHLERAMEIQADAFQNSLFDAGELAKEIEVIVQESQQKRDNPAAMLTESLHELAHDQHRIRRWRIGLPETLRAFRRDDLVDFVARTYRPGNIILSVVGDVRTEQVVELATKWWGPMPSGDLQRDTSPPEPPRQGFRYRRMQGDTRQRLLEFSLPAPPSLHPDTPAVMVLGSLLSDGRSARLYRKIKEELRLANSAWAGYEGFHDLGVFTLGAESIGDDPLPVEHALWAEVRRVQTELIDVADLDRIKARIESRRLFGQEDVLGMARTLTIYQALGDYRLSDVMLDQLRAVTPEDVRRVARDYLQISRASLLEYLPQSAGAPPALPPSEIAEVLRISAGRDPDSGAATHSGGRTIALPAPAPAVVSPLSNSGSAEVRQIPLPGGGRLLFKPRHDLPIVAMSILFYGGKRNETRNNCGITNLMLKSSVKGTRSYTSTQIAGLVEALGSGIGASASADYFGYGLKVKRESLREAFAVLKEVIDQPLFPESEVDREKQAIYGEIQRQQDSNFSLAGDLFALACYGDRHPYGLPASGIAEAITALIPTDVARWHATHVIAPAMVVGLVGDIEEAEAIDLFSGLARRDGPAPVLTQMPAGDVFAPFSERAASREKQQSAAVLGFPGAPLANADRYALDVLAEITSSMGGRFFRAVRGENALAYQVSSFHRTRVDAGNFMAYTATAPENEQRARDLILRECERLTREEVTSQELAAAQASILGEHVIGTQTFGAQAGELAAVGVHGLPPDEPARYLQRIEQVTPEMIRHVAHRYLHPDRYWLGVMRGMRAE